MPTTWLKGLLGWLSGLIFVVALLIAGSLASAHSESVTAVDLELPVLSRHHTLVERTV